MGNTMGLEVGNKLQFVFYMAKKPIGIIQDSEFLISKAAMSFKCGHGQQCVSLANIGEGAAV